VRGRSRWWVLSLLLLGPPAPGMASPPLLADAEAGIFLTSRRLSFQGEPPGPTRLRGYSSGSIAGPWLHVAGFPLAEVGGDLLAGLGIFADLASSVSLQTSVEGAQGTEQRPSWAWQAGAGLVWRVRPAPPLPLTLVPTVAYRWQSFTISPSVPGLPDARLAGICGSLGVELELGERFNLLADAGYVRWLGLAEMVGDAYFPSGRAQGFQASLGLDFRLAGALSLRAHGFYGGTWYALDTTVASPYQATGATDAYLGGRVTLRGTLAP
jgi:hypothetical protein